MSTTTTYTGVRIVDMPDLGAVTDGSSFVGEHAGSGRFAATALRTYVANAGTGNIGRNMLHNPLFAVQQRGQGTWVPAGSRAYTADRWGISSTAGSPMTAQLAAITAGNLASIGDEAAVWTLVATFTGSVAPGELTQFFQRVEGVRRLTGKTVTLSLWAWTASGNLSLGLSLNLAFGTGGSPSAGVNVPMQFVAITPTPARYTATFTVPSISGYTLGTNGDDYTQVNIWLSGPPGVQSGTVGIWGVQLEVGNVATPLEKPDPRYDLSNCQRFFATGTMSLNAYALAGAGFGYGAAFPVPPRASPTLTLTNVGSTNLSSITAASTGGGLTSYGIANATGMTLLSVNYTASADL